MARNVMFSRALRGLERHQVFAAPMTLVDNGAATYDRIFSRFAGGQLMASSIAYLDSRACNECGCIVSRHDEFCSLWTEPTQPHDADTPISYVPTDQSRSVSTAAASTPCTATDPVNAGRTFLQANVDGWYQPVALRWLAEGIEREQRAAAAVDARLDWAVFARAYWLRLADLTEPHQPQENPTAGVAFKLV